jgi:hypothetical protein
MNTEIRDHLNWLKGFADLVTNSTASDSGTNTGLRITRTATAGEALAGRVTGDTFNRFQLNAGGSLQEGPGNAAIDITLDRAALATLGPSWVSGSATGLANNAGKILGKWIGGTTELDGMAVGVYDTTDQTRSALLAFLGSNIPVVAMSRSGAGTTYLSHESTGRLTIRQADAALAGQLAVHVASSGVQNAIYAIVGGETQPRAALGVDSSGVGRLALGPGGSSVVDWDIHYTSARSAALDDQLDIRFGSIALPIKAGTPVDADVIGGIKVGSIMYDYSNNKLCVYDQDGSWKCTAAMT